MRYLILCLLLCITPPRAPAAGASDDPAMATSAPHEAVLKFHEVAAPDGVPLNVVEAGNPTGPPILFLHGFSQSYMSWLPQLQDPTLTARFRLVALDLRGHGASGKPWQASAYSGSKPWADDVRAVVKQLRLDRLLVVGWSFGGYVAMDYVREYGAASVVGVMLTGSHGGLVPRPPAAPPNVSPDLQLAMGGAQQFMKFMSANPLPKELFDRGVAAFLMLPPYARNAMAQKRLDNTDLAGTLSVPLLAVLGGADQTQSAVTLRHALAGAKQARVVVYDGVGHSVFAEATSRFDADLVGFANEVGMDNRAGDPVAVARRYVAAVNAGDADGALRMFDNNAVMYLNGGRLARGREALRAIESFHAVVRPRIEQQGLSVRMTDGRAVVSVERVVESSRIFDAMGLPIVTTERVDDGFVIRDGLIESARQPEFAPACRTVMVAAMDAVRGWLVTRNDPRLAQILPDGVPRMDSTTALAWISALEDWRSATGWQPAPAAQRGCAGGIPLTGPATAHSTGTTAATAGR